MKHLLRAMALLVAVSPALMAGSIWNDDFDREAHEEDAGATFMFQFNPPDGIYGITFGSGTWLKNTPVFGDYGLDMLSNGIEGEWYAGVGMTIRLMPHWVAAPFVGVGGSYHYSSADRETNAPPSESKPGEPADRGESYWAWHAEAGIRFQLPNRVRILELMGRYVWPGLDGEDREYWIAGIATGTGF